MCVIWGRADDEMTMTSYSQVIGHRRRSITWDPRIRDYFASNWQTVKGEMQKIQVFEGEPIPPNCDFFLRVL